MSKLLSLNSKLGKLAALFLLALLLPQFAYGGTVRKIIKKKRIVIISEGKKAGIKKNDEICFFDKNGDEIVCGKVQKVRNKSSYVKVRSKKKLRKIKKGFSAELKAAEGTTTVTSTAAVTKKSENRTNFKMMYLLTPVPPSQYKKISFKAPETGATSHETLWDQTEDAGISFVGGAGEFELGIGESFSLALGARYRAYRPFIADSDYDRGDQTVYARTNQEAVAYGGWLDFYFYQTGGPFYFRLGSGLDVDMSSVTFKSDKLADDESVVAVPIGDATSKLTLLSLRVPIQLNYYLSPVGLHFGLVPVIPLAEFGKAQEALVSDANASALADGNTGDVDLLTQLAHGKGSFGLEIVWGLYVAF